MELSLDANRNKMLRDSFYRGTTMIFNRLFLIVVGSLLFTGVALAQPAADFQRDFGNRLRPASVMEKDRLFQDLLQAANDQQRYQAPYRLFTATRLYEMARLRREDYGFAAKALGVMEQLDPAHRKEILTKLLELYQKAYGANKATNLGMGMGTMEVHLRLAGEITRQINEKIANSNLTPDQYANEVFEALLQIKMAQAIGAEVMNRVRGYEQQLLGKPDQESALAALRVFHDKLDEVIPRVLERVAALESYHRTCSEFARYKRQLADNAEHQAAAEKLVSLCLIELDDPHRALAYAKVGLNAQRQALLPLLDRPVRSVGPSQALAIGRWYQELAQEAQESSRPMMLASAKIYFEHHQAVAAPDDNDARQTSRLALAAIDAELPRLVSDEKKLASLLGARRDTLNPPAVATGSRNDPLLPRPRPDQGNQVIQDPNATDASPQRRPAAALPEKEILNTGKSIFDFGRD